MIPRLDVLDLSLRLRGLGRAQLRYFLNLYHRRERFNTINWV